MNLINSVDIWHLSWFFFFSAQSVTVILGAHRWSANEPSRATYYSAEIHIHPNFTPNEFHDEIALVKLNKSITFTSNIRFIINSKHLKCQSIGFKQVVFFHYPWTILSIHNMLTTWLQLAVGDTFLMVCLLNLLLWLYWLNISTLKFTDISYQLDKWCPFESYYRRHF